MVQPSQKFIEPAHFSGQSEQLQLESMGSQGIAIGQLGKGQQIRVTCTAKKVSHCVAVPQAKKTSPCGPRPSSILTSLTVLTCVPRCVVAGYRQGACQVVAGVGRHLPV